MVVMGEWNHLFMYASTDRGDGFSSVLAEWWFCFGVDCCMYIKQSLGSSAQDVHHFKWFVSL